MALPFASIADEIVVITARDSPISSLTIKAIRRIYRKETLIDGNGTKWVPVNLSTDHRIRQAFSLDLFNKRPEEMELYWNAQYFKGILPPHVVDSQEAMVSFVANTPGAIGYIAPCHLNDRIKIVARLEIKSPTPLKTCPP